MWSKYVYSVMPNTISLSAETKNFVKILLQLLCLISFTDYIYNVLLNNHIKIIKSEAFCRCFKMFKITSILKKIIL
jgi:hypothetical protein